MLLSSRFLLRSLSQNKQIYSPSSTTLASIIGSGSHEIINSNNTNTTSLHVVSKRYFADRKEFNNNNAGGYSGRVRRDFKDTRDYRDSNRGESFGDRPFGTRNPNRRSFDGPGNRQEGSGEKPVFVARTLSPDQQNIVAESKFNQFLETAPSDLEARLKITVSIMSNFSRNDNSHSVLNFFNRLISLKKDTISLSQAHYALCIKELLKLGDEKGALKNYENMKQSGIFPDERMLGNLLFFSAKSSDQMLDVLAADSKKYKLVLPPSSASSAVFSLIRDREFSKAKALFARLINEFGVVPDVKLNSLQMTLLLRDEQDKSEEAIQLYNKLRPDNGADAGLYFALIKGLTFRKQYEKLETIMKNMKSDGIKLDDKFTQYLEFINGKDPTAFEIIQKNL